MEIEDYSWVVLNELRIKQMHSALPFASAHLDASVISIPYQATLETI